MLVGVLKVLDNANIGYTLKEEQIKTFLPFEDTKLLNKKLGRKGLKTLSLLSEGNTYEEIATKLNISIAYLSFNPIAKANIS